MQYNKEKVGVISGLFIEQMILKNHDVIKIPKNNIVNTLKEHSIKKVYIETNIYETDHEWFNENTEDLQVILESMNIEVVYISFEKENVSLSRFNQLIIKDVEDIGNNQSLPYLVNEHIHNPKGTSKKNDVYFLKAEDCKERLELLELIQTRKMKTKHLSIIELNRNTINEIIETIRKSKIIYIYNNNVLPHQFLKYIELVATLSNTIVIFEGLESHSYAINDDNNIDNIYLIQALIENKIFFDKTIISKTRKAFMNNTFMFRKTNDYMKKNVKNNLISEKISVLISTKRKEFIPGFIKQINNQHNVDLQIVLITHGFQLTRKEVKELRKMSKYHLDIVFCDETISFGHCLNQGMKSVKHEYVIKMDDDDYYFPYFIIDILIGLKYSQEKLVGKYGFFFYLEQTNLTGYRRTHKQYQHVSEIKGNTLLCESQTMRKYGYEDISRHVDSDFIKRIKEDGGKIYCIHPYDMCVFRAADKEGHTYQVDDSRFLRDATMLYKGKPNKTISSENVF